MNEEKTVERSCAYVWFDAEFTHLDVDKTALLQVAMIITDRSLKRLLPPGRDVNLLVRLAPDAEISEWVRQNLAALVECARSPEAPSRAEIDLLLAERVAEAIGEIPADIRKRPVLAGNSIHADRRVIEKLLPRFAASLHYRMLDVSSWKIGWLDHYEQPEFDKKNLDLAVLNEWGCEVLPAGGEHDAYYDILASLAEYRHYLNALTAPA